MMSMSATQYTFRPLDPVVILDKTHEHDAAQTLLQLCQPSQALASSPSLSSIASHSSSSGSSSPASPPASLPGFHGKLPPLQYVLAAQLPMDTFHSALPPIDASPMSSQQRPNESLSSGLTPSPSSSPMTEHDSRPRQRSLGRPSKSSPSSSRRSWRAQTHRVTKPSSITPMITIVDFHDTLPHSPLSKPRWQESERVDLLEAIIRDKQLDDMSTFCWDRIALTVGRAKKACKDQWRREVLPALRKSLRQTSSPSPSPSPSPSL